MTDDLFGALPSFLKLPLTGSDITYFPSINLNDAPDKIARRLQINIDWRAEEISVWGKKFLQPRLVAWHGNPGLDYSYSGIRLNPKPWTEELLRLKNLVESISADEFNSVLLNYYRNHQDSMGFHSDDEVELGPRPTIASLSLGESRVLVFKHKTNKSIRPYRLPLQSGSLLIMKGDTQRNWVHGIEKSARECGARVNLTFRTIFQK